MKNKEFFTITELAQILGVSRVAVFKKIKKREIQAQKIGRMFAIPKQELGIILGQTLTKEQKRIIDAGIKKTTKEYSKTLEMLGNE